MARFLKYTIVAVILVGTTLIAINAIYPQVDTDLESKGIRSQIVDHIDSIDINTFIMGAIVITNPEQKPQLFYQLQQQNREDQQAIATFIGSDPEKAKLIKDYMTRYKNPLVTNFKQHPKQAYAYIQHLAAVYQLPMPVLKPPYQPL